MAVVAWVIGVAAVALVATVVYGLLTRRLDWRADGCCCPTDPADDPRMRAALGPELCRDRPRTHAGAETGTVIRASR